MDQLVTFLRQTTSVIESLTSMIMILSVWTGIVIYFHHKFAGLVTRKMYDPLWWGGNVVEGYVRVYIPSPPPRRGPTTATFVNEGQDEKEDQGSVGFPTLHLQGSMKHLKESFLSKWTRDYERFKETGIFKDIEGPDSFLRSRYRNDPKSIIGATILKVPDCPAWNNNRNNSSISSFSSHHL